ncbi:hypothetical protein T12_1587 [Trichinella patagoniensis]|uniref:Uncharacterized protein n=1 Tax=Trichinella patagoniensis TaxID=990121 RepID=A0A0V1A8V8_9BILA|nr:hypothetical protein T12_1587 [Trichinella patagoniensis]
MKIGGVHPEQNPQQSIKRGVLRNPYRTLNGFTKDSSPPVIIISPRKRPRLRKGKFPSPSTSYSATEFCNAVLSWISSTGLWIRFPCL